MELMRWGWFANGLVAKQKTPPFVCLLDVVASLAIVSGRSAVVSVAPALVKSTVPRSFRGGKALSRPTLSRPALSLPLSLVRHSPVSHLSSITLPPPKAAVAQTGTNGQGGAQYCTLALSAVRTARTRPRYLLTVPTLPRCIVEIESHGHSTRVLLGGWKGGGWTKDRTKTKTNSAIYRNRFCNFIRCCVHTY